MSLWVKEALISVSKPSPGSSTLCFATGPYITLPGFQTITELIISGIEVPELIK